MKLLILTLGSIVAFVASSAFLTSCGGDTSKEADSTEQHDSNGHDHDSMATTTFSCSMHPEITGKEGDKCSKCGMALTVATADDHDMNMSATKAKCPMHPEEMGKEGDKCSKCGMALVFNASEEHTHKD